MSRIARLLASLVALTTVLGGAALAGATSTPAETIASHVHYRFPDGTVQQVPTVVAKALDAAFKGSKARDAYPSGYAWVTIGPEDLRTGDAAKWKNYNALLVIKSGNVKAIVNGKLESFKRDARGGFKGFYHPVKS